MLRVPFHRTLCVCPMNTFALSLSVCVYTQVMKVERDGAVVHLQGLILTNLKWQVRYPFFSP